MEVELRESYRQRDKWKEEGYSNTAGHCSFLHFHFNAVNPDSVLAIGGVKRIACA